MTEVYKEFEKEEAVEAFRTLLERDDVMEVEVRKVFFEEEKGTCYSKLMFRVLLKE